MVLSNEKPKDGKGMRVQIDPEYIKPFNWKMCYKSGEKCKYNCNGLCKDSN